MSVSPSSASRLRPTQDSSTAGISAQSTSAQDSITSTYTDPPLQYPWPARESPSSACARRVPPSPAQLQHAYRELAASNWMQPAVPNETCVFEYRLDDPHHWNASTLVLDTEVTASPPNLVPAWSQFAITNDYSSGAWMLFGTTSTRVGHVDQLNTFTPSGPLLNTTWAPVAHAQDGHVAVHDRTANALPTYSGSSATHPHAPYLSKHASAVIGVKRCARDLDIEYSVGEYVAQHVGDPADSDSIKQQPQRAFSGALTHRHCSMELQRQPSVVEDVTDTVDQPGMSQSRCYCE